MLKESKAVLIRAFCYRINRQDENSLTKKIDANLLKQERHKKNFCEYSFTVGLVVTNRKLKLFLARVC